MPTVSPNEGINIPFTGDADKLVAEQRRVWKEMDEIKEHSRRMSDESVRHSQAMEQAAQKQTMSWTEFRSMYSTVLDVVRVGQAVWEETGQKFIDNAVTVGDFARALGTTTEEASRLKEVADDVGVSTETLRTSLKMAQKDGIEPNVAGLAQLADQYNALAPGVERTQFLLDKFGKSGEDMGKLLEKGGDSIRNMAAAMDEGMIVTQDAYEQARQYQISVDALKDSWDALTYEAAPPLVNAMTFLINNQRDLNRATELATESGRNYNQLTVKQQQDLKEQAKAEREQADATLLATEAAEGAGVAFETEAEQAARLKEEARQTELAIKAVTEANEEYLSMVGSISKEHENYTETVNKLNEIHATLLEEKRALIEQGYSEEGAKIQEVNAKLLENEEAMRKAADEFELAGRRRILSMLEQQLAIDGLNQRETEYLLSKGLEWGVYSESAVAAAQAAQQEVAALTNELNSIPTNKVVTVDTYLNTYTNSYGSPSSGAGYVGHAAGGSFMIPQSYGNEGFRLGNNDTASGGELINITPRGQSGNGNGVTVNIMLDSATPDPERVAYNIKPYVQRALRDLGVNV